jgi:hypothetical protein
MYISFDLEDLVERRVCWFMDTDKLYHIDIIYIIIVQFTLSGVLLNSRMREIELTLLKDAAKIIQQ